MTHTVAIRTGQAGRYAALARLMVRHGPTLRAGASEETITPEVEADAEQLASDLESMGPTFVKLGQLLSTRSDLLPEAHLRALARLQDDLQPFSSDEAQAVFESELHLRVKDAFAEFDPIPMAAASLGQVHRARLANGRRVVVKIQRPGIEEVVAADLDALRQLASLIDHHTDAGRRYGFGDLLDQFARAMTDELDYGREAANLERLAEATSERELIIVPRPVKELTSRKVLTMDEVDGRKITDVSPLGLLDLDGRALAETLLAAYLDQIFVAGFFHADPHPGNVLVTGDGRLGLIDVGMVGHVRPELRSELFKIVLAVEDGRGEDAGRILADMGNQLEDFDQDRLLREVAAVVARSSDLTIGDVRAGELLSELSRVSAECGLRPPPEMSMLARALLSVDSVVKALAPDLDVSAVIREQGPRLAGAQLHTSRLGALSALVEAKDFAEALPGRVGRLMDSLAEGDLQVKVHAFDEAEMLRGIQKVANRVTMGLVIAALVLGAAVMSRTYPTVALAAFVAAGLCGFILILSIVAADRHINSRARRRRRQR